MIITCPKGHPSAEPDFCSECGAKIGGSSVNVPSAPSLAPNSPGASGVGCPDCGTQRTIDGSSFCELCGYNFETGSHGEIPLPAQSVPDTPPAPKWTVQITVDAALKEPESPDPPADWTPRSLPVERDTLLIGRTGRSRATTPDIALDFDSGVSTRHALLTRTHGIGWTIRDIGSSNGTRLNGTELQPMVDVLLKAGDRVTLGHWSCLTLAEDGQP
jgi:FHA domain